MIDWTALYIVVLCSASLVIGISGRIVFEAVHDSRRIRAARRSVPAHRKVAP